MWFRTCRYAWKLGVKPLHMCDHADGSFVLVQFGRNERPLRNIVSLGSQDELQLKDQVIALPSLHLYVSKRKLLTSVVCAGGDG